MGTDQYEAIKYHDTEIVGSTGSRQQHKGMNYLQIHFDTEKKNP